VDSLDFDEAVDRLGLGGPQVRQEVGDEGTRSFAGRGTTAECVARPRVLVEDVCEEVLYIVVASAAIGR